VGTAPTGPKPLLRNGFRGPGGRTTRGDASRFGVRGKRHLMFSTSAREGGTDAKRMGHHPAPSRPVPRADPTPDRDPHDHPGGRGKRVGAGHREVLVWAPRRDPSAIDPAAPRADRGFDAQARTRVS
jgi:hypothetical protein